MILFLFIKESVYICTKLKRNEINYIIYETVVEY